MSKTWRPPVPTSSRGGTLRVPTSVRGGTLCASFAGEASTAGACFAGEAGTFLVTGYLSAALVAED